MNLAEQLAETLRRVRDESGMTQKGMAKRLGMSHATLHRLERGDRNTSLKTVESLCAAFGCSLADLFEVGRLQLPSRRQAQRKTPERRRAT